MVLPLILSGKFISKLSTFLNAGNGSTWPGHIALSLNKNFVKNAFKDSATKVIIITGTNGKTTTSKLVQTILEKNKKKVFINNSGANLLNGIASSIIISSSYSGKINYDYAIFEVDENSLPQVLQNIEPDYLIALNLFRDQLDRYGELDLILKKWKDSYSDLTKTELILNADDPQIAFLGFGYKGKTSYFGLEKKGGKTRQHASDSILCPNCGAQLKFETYYFSHLGKWSCLSCQFRRVKPTLSNFPRFPLEGEYAKYDLLAAALLASRIGIKETDIISSLENFQPAFGRQEEININGTKIKLFLSKNPTSFNESLKTILGLKAKNLLIILNDKIPDGKDVSWIWDVDFEILKKEKINIFISGDRVYDLAIRLKYAGVSLKEKNIFESVKDSINVVPSLSNESLFILPTYSGMLEAREALTGKKIL